MSNPERVPRQKGRERATNIAEEELRPSPDPAFHPAVPASSDDISSYRAAAEELRAQIAELREETNRHKKMLYTHGGGGTYEADNSGLSGILGPWFLGDAPAIRRLYWDEAAGDFLPGFWRWVCAVVDITFRAFGEAIFVDNTWTSIVLIICMAVRDWYSTFLTLIATAVTVIYTMRIRLFPRPMVLKSLYSYNTVLASVAIVLFAHNDKSPFHNLDGPGIFAFILTNILCFMTVCIFRFSETLAPYTTTFPYAISCVIVLVAAKGKDLSMLNFNSFRRSLPLVSLLTASSNHTETTTTAAILHGIPNGFGEMVFCDTWELSLAMWLSVAFHSQYMAVIALLGAVVSATTAVGLGAPLDEVATGLWGYNAVACALLVSVTWPRASIHDAWGTLKAGFVACLISALVTFFHAAFKSVLVRILGVAVFSWPSCFVMTMYITIVDSPLMFGAKKTETTTQFVKSDATIRKEDSERRGRRRGFDAVATDDDELVMI